MDSNEKVSRPPNAALAAYTKSHGIEWRDYALALETRAKALADAVASFQLDNLATAQALDAALKALRELMEGTE